MQIKTENIPEGEDGPHCSYIIRNVGLLYFVETTDGSALPIETQFYSIASCIRACQRAERLAAESTVNNRLKGLL